MLASASDAEDVVQDACLRYQAALARGEKVESTKAYLSTVVARLSIDELRSARNRRETYSGGCLPEPIVTDDFAPESRVVEAESLTMSFLLLLDHLTPVERAVFLLHDVFAYEFAEIAEIIGKTEANCRQLAVRARRRIRAERPQFAPSRLECASSVRKRRAREFVACQLEHIEDEQDRGPRRDGLCDGLLRERQTLLQRAKVRLTALVGDHDFAVNQRDAR